MFLKRAKQSLRPNGVIILKDNMARQGCRLDPVDSSLIRHLDIMHSIIQKAGLTILDTQKQEGLPDIIVPVWMIAMQWDGGETVFPMGGRGLSVNTSQYDVIYTHRYLSIQ